MNPLSFLVGGWQRWAIYGALLIAYGIVAAGLGYHQGVKQLWDYQVDQAREAVRIVVKQAVVTEKIVTEYIYVQGKTRTITNTIEKEVIKYVEARLDLCPLSVAARELHDSAAANTIPNPARTTDGAASGLATAALTETCTANYATYHSEANN